MHTSTDLTKSLSTLFDTGLSFARYGLNVAGAAVNYASEILKDVSVELKAAGDRVAPTGRTEEPHTGPTESRLTE
jgi:hypothetical protein